MSMVNISSDFGSAVQSVLDDMNAGVYNLDQRFGAALSEFAGVFDTVSPTALQLSSTAVRLNYVSDNENFRLNLTGSGIGPVSSLSALLAAIDGGLASGAITRVTVQRVTTATTTLLTLDTAPGGYTLTTGVDVITVSGSLPQSFEDLFELGGLLSGFDMTTLSGMTETDRTAYFSALSAYGLTGVSFATNGTTLGGFSISPGGFSLSVGPLTLTIMGSFPADFGQIASVAFDIFEQTQLNGEPLNLSGLAGLSVMGLQLTGPGGVQLMQISGPFTDQFSLIVDELNIGTTGWAPTAGIILVHNDAAPEPIYTPEEGSVVFGRNSASIGDTVYGGDGDDYMLGQAGRDHMVGDGGADALFGGTENDTLSGGYGNDTIDGGAGVDLLLLGLGSTWMIDNRVDLNLISAQSTGEGRDVIMGIENVDAGGGDDLVIGNAANNALYGNEGDDSLLGNDGLDYIVGGLGNDTVDGGTGHDGLLGGVGNDVLRGGAGADTLTGGLGRDNMAAGVDGARDVFVFNSVAESGNHADRDIITGFVRNSDVLQLSGIDANTALAGNQAFTWGGLSSGVNKAWYNSVFGGITVFADVNGDGVADFSVRIMGIGTIATADMLL